MRTIRPVSAAPAFDVFGLSVDLDAELRHMGIKPNRRRRAALLSWNIFGSDDYVTATSGFQERRKG